MRFQGIKVFRLDLVLIHDKDYLDIDYVNKVSLKHF